MIVLPDKLRRLTQAADIWVKPINDSLDRNQINTVARLHYFLATCLYESGGFKTLIENLNYDAAGILRMWPTRFSPQEAQAYARQPERIANRAYAGRGGNAGEESGDGWLYRGRGPIQCTFLGNYIRYERLTGYAIVADPDLVLEPVVGMAVSASFWMDRGCNQVADELDFQGTQGIVNRGNPNKLADNMQGRRVWLQKVQSALQ